jgi:replicative DNA helicase
MSKAIVKHKKPLFSVSPGTGDLSKEIPPSSPELEKSILGVMLNHPESISKVVPILQDTDFFTPFHQKTYRAMVSLWEERKNIDIMTVHQKLKELGYDEPESVVYLSDLEMKGVSDASIEVYARTLSEYGIRRNIILNLREIVATSYDETENVHKILVDSNAVVQKLLGRFSTQSIVHISTGVSQVENDFARIMSGEIRNEDIRFGIKELDDLTGGIESDDLVVVSGPEKSGKSSLAVQVALYNAKRSNAVLVFSQEMSLKKLLTRMAIIEANVNWVRALERKMTTDEWNRLGIALNDISRYPIYVSDQVNTVTSIRAGVEAFRSQNIRLIVIDYLQITESEGKGYETREREVSYMSTQFKLLTKRMKIPVIVVSAVNKEGFARESRQIQYDMDKLIRINVNKDGAVDEERRIIETKIEVRQRMALGADMGDVTLGYCTKTGSWVSMSYNRDVPPSQENLF